MPAKQNKAKEKLETLAHYLRLGWKKLHPVSEENLTKFREAVQAQWEEEQSKIREKGRSKQKSKSHEQDQEHEY